MPLDVVTIDARDIIQVALPNTNTGPELMKNLSKENLHLSENSGGNANVGYDEARMDAIDAKSRKRRTLSVDERAYYKAHAVHV